ncbi:sterol desaturase family protein [Kiloniella antarctica]|uniref:Sterol desaturase family protein n=1 Tax=Kiloniella antarctica TaxID=1550907 RepID=A0ABW5BII5_9PROT
MWINIVLEYWLVSPWYIALVMAIFVHLGIYFLGGIIGQVLTTKIWPKMGIGCIIDQYPARLGQVQNEIKKGIMACFLFGVVTLFYRHITIGLWPESWIIALVQFVVFFIYYNLYAYLSHRLLHTKYLIKYHAVHHSSVRVTPWSGYNVHPVEALIMAGILPIFMFFVPLSIGSAFVIHTLGMMFTTCIHCNYDLVPQFSKKHWFRQLVNDPAFHRLHHTKGDVNYGFGLSFMDRIFGTYDPDMFDELDLKRR